MPKIHGYDWLRGSAQLRTIPSPPSDFRTTAIHLLTTAIPNPTLSQLTPLYSKQRVLQYIQIYPQKNRTANFLLLHKLNRYRNLNRICFRISLKPRHTSPIIWQIFLYSAIAFSSFGSLPALHCALNTPWSSEVTAGELEVTGRSPSPPRKTYELPSSFKALPQWRDRKI